MKSVFDGISNSKNSLLILWANEIGGFTDMHVFRKNQKLILFFSIHVQRRHQENKCMHEKGLKYVQS